VLPEPLDYKETQETKERRAKQDRREYRAKPENRDRREQQDHKVIRLLRWFPTVASRSAESVFSD